MHGAINPHPFVSRERSDNTGVPGTRLQGHRRVWNANWGNQSADLRRGGVAGLALINFVSPKFVSPEFSEIRRVQLLRRQGTLPRRRNKPGSMPIVERRQSAQKL